MALHLFNTPLYSQLLSKLPENKLLINTINAHSYNVAQKDNKFRNSLQECDILIPDGISVVWAAKWLTGKKLRKIAGDDLFYYEMKRLEKSGGSCFFLGSSEVILQKIMDRALIEYPNIKLGTYSPPYKPEFNAQDNKLMIQAVNDFNPDVLFIGMTAPKQEKWAHQHFEDLHAGHIECIGAVFDFYAGTVRRAPQWMISIGLEWLFRLTKEPRRMYRRYLIGNIKFIASVVKEKFSIYLFYKTEIDTELPRIKD